MSECILPNQKLNQKTQSKKNISILEQVQNPIDVQEFNFDELTQLVDECRERIIQATSKAGGHLASSLGTVELTIALYHVFNGSKDCFIWDVGHQAYTHKILTGRNHKIDQLGLKGGIGKFLRREESPFDYFGAGHASTSISASTGMTVAQAIQYPKNQQSKVVAIIGDGALTGGMAYEAMNHLGDLDMDMTVILNDNEMSIDPNVGALSTTFNKIQTSNHYNKFRSEISKLEGSGTVSNFIHQSLKRINDSLMEFLSPSVWFEKLGFRYLGPVDGHDLKKTIEILDASKKIKGPVIVHLITKKGKGYSHAESDSLKYHGVTPFVPSSGEFIQNKKSGKSYTSIWSEVFEYLLQEDKKITGTSAAMIGSVGLKKMQKKYPQRIFDVGIAEAHAVTFNAGLATQGLNPFVAIYSTFLQRALDQIIHDVALQNLPVKFVLDRAGFVGADGATHHGIFDLTYLRMIPNLIVMAPKNGKELTQMVYTMAQHHHSPIAIRFPRGNAIEYFDDFHEGLTQLKIGEGEIIQKGKHILICTIGTMLYRAQEVAQEIFDTHKITSTIINARFVKPLDAELILNEAKKHQCIITIEENIIKGGFGSAILELCSENNFFPKIKILGIPDQFIEYSKPEEQLEIALLDKQNIKQTILEFYHNI